MAKIFVQPKNACGSVEHYFHFLFGYLMPFLDNVPADDENLYLFRDCGPVMNEILLKVPGYRISLLGSESFDSVVGFAGYDSPDFPGMDMAKSRGRAMEVFGSGDGESDGRILVVDRARPHDFYEKDAEVTTSGSSRRSVPNMREIYERIAERFPADMVCLEGMDLGSQIKLFSSRRRFVMQHGAAMANLLFARKGSLLLEIRSDHDGDYFLKMRRELGIRFERVHQEGRHGRVDPKIVLSALENTIRASLKVL